MCSLLTGELFARLVLGLGNPPLSVTHPNIEYLFKPNQNLYRFGNYVQINEYGMRSEGFSRRKLDSSEFRILVFGDSVLNGGSQTDQADLATSIVARELTKQYDSKVLVGNISAGSWGPGNWLAYVKTYGFFDANGVILVMSSHDTADNPTFAPLNPNTHPTKKPWSALVEGVTRYLLPRYLPGLPGPEESDKPVAAGPDGEIEGLRDLTDFLQMAKAAAPQVIVFLHLSQEELASGVAEPGHWRAREVCKVLSISCFSLQPYFEKAMAKGIEPYRDNIHPNVEGQKLMAEAILDHMPSERPGKSAVGQD